MANMSYCRFENTYNDLCDCLNVLKYEGIQGIESDREKEAAEDLLKIALRYIEVYNDAKK